MAQRIEKTLVAGAWVGEFGWELFCWQGYIRKLSKQYDKTIVYSRNGHEYLYKDFAEFRPFNPICKELNGFRCEGIKDKFQLPDNLIKADWIDGSVFNIGFNYNGNLIENESGLFFEQEFIRLGHERDTMKYDVLLNIRNKCSERDWPHRNWINIVDSLRADGLRVATVGNLELSLGMDNIDDHRGISLKDLSYLMSKSKLLISPSSGVSHFASLCELPHLVWSSDFNKLKYSKYWNPFNTKCIFYSSEGWNPKPESIHKLVVKYLKNGSN